MVALKLYSSLYRSLYLRAVSLMYDKATSPFFCINRKRAVTGLAGCYYQLLLPVATC